MGKKNGKKENEYFRYTVVEVVRVLFAEQEPSRQDGKFSESVIWHTDWAWKGIGRADQTV